MHILVMIAGLLLLLFGGGCTLFVVGLGLIDFRNFINDLPNVLPILVPFGILPLVVGWLMFRWGLSRDRAKRKAAAAPFNTADRKVD
jgi:hypothetical protein